MPSQGTCSDLSSCFVRVPPQLKQTDSHWWSVYLPAGPQGTSSPVQVAIEDVQVEGRLRVAAQPLLGVDRLATVLQVRAPVLLSAFRQPGQVALEE